MEIIQENELDGYEMVPNILQQPEDEGHYSTGLQNVEQDLY